MILKYFPVFPDFFFKSESRFLHIPISNFEAKRIEWRRSVAIVYFIFLCMGAAGKVFCCRLGKNFSVRFSVYREVLFLLYIVIMMMVTCLLILVKRVHIYLVLNLYFLCLFLYLNFLFALVSSLLFLPSSFFSVYFFLQND